MDFSRKPIIVLGVNHSGTRVLVEVLKRLGSDGGNYENEWNENKFFLRLHEQMISKVSGMTWTKTIFNLQFIKSFKDNGSVYNYLRSEINNSLQAEYQKYESHPWHWKCPSCILFLETWQKIFPHAYYIYIKRNDFQVVESLMARKQFYTLRAAREFVQTMNDRVNSMHFDKFLAVNYENLEKELVRIIDFLPLNPNPTEIASAINVIRKRPRKWWDPRNSIKHNLWIISIKTRIGINKLAYKSS